MVISDHESEKFNALLSAIAPAVYAWAAARFGAYKRGGDASDFAHDVFVRASQSYSPREVDDSVFRAWIFSIARYMLLEWYRAESARRTLGMGVGGRATPDGVKGLVKTVTSVSRRVARDEQLKLLVCAIAALEDTEQRLAVEYLLEGRSAAQVASDLGFESEGAVRTRAYRVRERLIAEFPFAHEFLAE